MATIHVGVFDSSYHVDYEAPGKEVSKELVYFFLTSYLVSSRDRMIIMVSFL